MNEYEEAVAIINRIKFWTSDQTDAIKWYQTTPIPAFENRTAEQLVKEGKANAVHDFIDSIVNGGFA